MAQLPSRGERYRGPEGYVEVLAVDGPQGKVTVQVAGGGEQRDIELEEWRNSYSFAPTGSGPGVPKEATANDELSAAARRGYEGRVQGKREPEKPE